MEFDRFTDENYDGLLADDARAFEGTKSNCRPSHAVQIEKSLRGKSPENGIFPIRAGDFRHFLAEVAGFWSLETVPIRQESPYFKGFS